MGIERLSTKELPHDEWLALRRRGIGGSDTPVVVLGERHPFRTPRQLWEEKTGRSPDVEETPAMRRGTVLEPVVADLYREVTGRKLRFQSTPPRGGRLPRDAPIIPRARDVVNTLDAQVASSR